MNHIPANTKQRKSIALDICKGIAILMIIIVHNRHFVLTNMDGMRQLINFGQMGCQLFFVVSGFALCYSWEHLLQKDSVTDNNTFGQNCKQGIRRYFSFIGKRYLRIWPGFVLIILINLLLNILLDDLLHISPGFIIKRKPQAILLNIFLLHGFSPKYINNVAPGGWYIGTQIILYALFPLLYWLFKKLHKCNHYLIILIPIIFWWICSYILKQFALINDGEFYPYNNSFAYFSFVNQLPCFSLGILLFFQEKNRFVKKCPFIISLAAFLGSLCYSIYLYLQPEADFLFLLIPFWSGIAFYWMCVSALHLEQKHVFSTSSEKNVNTDAMHSKSHQIISSLLRQPITFLASCGRLSYGIYLVHGFFSWYMIKALTTTLIEHEIVYSDIALYFILYIPTVFLAYHTGKFLQNHILNKLTQLLSRRS